jgi:hypothetical protein
MMDVGQRPGVEVVDANHAMAASEQFIAEMRPEKAAATSHKAGGHWGRRIAVTADAAQARAAL